MRDIQYAAASRFYHQRLWNTGSPAFAGDDGREIASHSRGAMRPSCDKLFAPKNRGRGECRVLAAPTASRAKLSEAHEHSHHRYSRDHPAFPHAMVLTAYFVLSR